MYFDIRRTIETMTAMRNMHAIDPITRPIEITIAQMMPRSTTCPVVDMMSIVVEG
ncbi:MAG: hypothetical protein AAB582_03590 [Patescibacteria group bacterium]